MRNDTDFITTLGLGFLAHRLRRITEQFLDDYGAWLPDVGVDVPPRSLSLLLLLHRNESLGVMEVAARLRLSHPLIIRLVRDLEGEGFVQTTEDPEDARRRVIRLTARGERQVTAIKKATTVMAAAYRELSDEIGVDLLEVVERIEAANSSRAFQVRLRARALRARKTTA